MAVTVLPLGKEPTNMKRWMMICAMISLFAASEAVWADEGEAKSGWGRRGGGMNGFGPWGLEWCLHHKEAVKSLGVTDEQWSQLREMMYQGEIRRIKGRAELELARLELRRQLENANPKGEVVDKIIDQISGMEAQLQKERIRQRFKARAICGEEMFEKILHAMKTPMRESGMDCERGSWDERRALNLRNDAEERESALPEKSPIDGEKDKD
jgi:Spy/CpxP family protein refolding chaperone